MCVWRFIFVVNHNYTCILLRRCPRRCAVAFCSPRALAQKSCVRADENNIADDLQTGCTGLISEGDLVIKDWDPPLHFYCARRLWKESVTQTLKAKKIIKEIGTTEEEEAAQPSAAVPEGL